MGQRFFCQSIFHGHQFSVHKQIWLIIIKKHHEIDLCAAYNFHIPIIRYDGFAGGQPLFAAGSCDPAMEGFEFITFVDNREYSFLEPKIAATMS